MFTVTDSATEHLANLLDQSETEADIVARLIEKEGQLDLVLGQAQPDDVTFQQAEKTVLAVAPEISQALEERSLDTKQTDQGVELIIT